MSLSSAALEAIYRCNCTSPRLGVVDGDTDCIYCGNCEGKLGEIGDVIILKGDRHENSTSIRNDQ